jgi:hypothetical protein
MGRTYFILNLILCFLITAESLAVTYEPSEALNIATFSGLTSQTITNFSDMTKTYGVADFDPGAKASPSNLPVTYSSDNTLVATIENNKVHIVGAGTANITAFQTGNGTYSSATLTKKLTVNKANQTLTSGGNIIKTYPSEEFNLGAYSSSGLPVTYTIANSAVAVLTFDGIKIVGAGTTNITISQSGNNNYNSVSVTITLTVNKASQTITFSSLQDVYYGYPDFDPAATASSDLTVTYTSSDENIAKIINNKVHIIATGDVTITAHQAGNTNYSAALDVSQNLRINKAEQSISFGQIQSRVWGDSDVDLTATTSSGLPISFVSSNTTVATVNNGKIHITGVGTTYITAAQGGNANFAAAADVKQIFNVSKANQMIPFNSIPEKAVGSPDFVLPATSSVGLPLVYSSDNTAVGEIFSGNWVKIKGAGLAHIKALQGGNAYYEAASEVTQNLVVKNAWQTISFDPLPSKTYGDGDFTISGSSDSNLPVYFISDNSNIATISGSTVHIQGAGTANIYAIQDGNTNYAAATPVLQQLVVAKAAQSITLAPIPDKKYADGPFIPVANATSGLAVEFTSSDPNVAIVSGGKIYLTGIGTTIITASQGGSENFTAAVPVIRTLKVTKSSQTILFASITQKTYGDPDFNPGAEASSYLGITYSSSNNSIASIVNNKVHIVGVGTCNIYASQNGDDYYNAAVTISQQLTVVQASQVINFDPLSAVTYGSADFEINASASSGLNVAFSSSNSTVATVVNGVVHVINAGSTYIIATQSGNEKYNEATAVSQLLVVNKQSQIIVLDTIYAKTYGCADFVPDGLSSSGLPVSYFVDNPNVATVVSGKVHVKGVGKTTIRARQAGAANYNMAEEVSRVLFVEKASLNVTPVSVSRNYLESNPVFTCKYDGFVNNEEASEIDVAPKVSTDADMNSFPGIYDLIASGGLDNNYKFNYQKGILLILGTMPLKASKPTGNSLLCVNPENQEYTTEGAVFAYSYEWSMNPTQAGIISSSGRILKVDFNDTYTGRVAIAVKAFNNKGVGATSDSLIINILPKPQLPAVKLRGTYCSSNSFGDSIKILDSQSLYQYQLYQNGEEYGESITGTGGGIAWGNLMVGDYKISEEVCNVGLAEGLLIKEVDPSSTKPVLQVKWNDVIVCLDNGDSIESFSWYRSGNWLPGEAKQYLWTQKEEGHYYVKTTDRDGCIFSSDSVWIDKMSTGQLYPNPNDGNFKITFTNSQTGKVTIRIINSNSSPVKVLSYPKSEELFETDISLPDIVPGTYFVDVLLNGERVFYQKFIRK